MYLVGIDIGKLKLTLVNSNTLSVSLKKKQVKFLLNLYSLKTAEMDSMYCFLPLSIYLRKIFSSVWKIQVTIILLY